MARWLVQLEGDRFDLEEFPRWFPDGDIFFTEEKTTFFLVGRALEKLPDAAAVQVEAMRALEECSSIISLLCPNIEKPATGNVIREEDDGSRGTFIFVPLAGVRARAKVGAMLTGGAQPEAPSPTQAQQLQAAASANPRLRTAVWLWGRPGRSWPRLYTIGSSRKSVGENG
jgi:hypothetical protein